MQIQQNLNNGLDAREHDTIKIPDRCRSEWLGHNLVIAGSPLSHLSSSSRSIRNVPQLFFSASTDTIFQTGSKYSEITVHNASTCAKCN